MGDRGKSPEGGRAVYDVDMWSVTWGFDPGDVFLVFPILPGGEREGAWDRWSRSLELAKKRGEILSIGSEAVDCLLLEELVRRFDPEFEMNRELDTGYRDRRFDWYHDNAYTLADCLCMAGTLEQAAEGLDGVRAEDTVRLDGSSVVARDVGDPVNEEDAPDRFFCRIDAMPAGIARDRALRIADGIRRVVEAAREHGCDAVTFCGP